MKHFLLAAILVTASLTSTAQQPKTTAPVKDDPAAVSGREAKVERLFVAMHVERTMDQMMTMMQQMITQSTKSMQGVDALTPAQEKLVADFQKRSMQLAEDSVGWKAMEPEYARLYAATFTDAEIDAMIAFYTSPAGQAMVDKTPQISQQTMQVVQTKIAAMQPRLREMAADLAEQMKAAAPATPKPSPSR